MRRYVDDDEDDLDECPHCRRQIYADSERCPGCGHYLTREDARPAGRSWWFIVLAVICLLVALGWALGR
jgi:uncharacterized paraquat-inducible protein A